MAMKAQSYTSFILLVGVSSLLIIKAEIKNSTGKNADAWNATVINAKQGKTIRTEAHTITSTVSKEKTSPKEFLENKAPLKSETMRVHIYSTIKTSTAGDKLISNASTILGNNTLSIFNTSTTGVSVSSTLSSTSLYQETTSTNYSKSPLANSDVCEEAKKRGLMICFIIIAALVLLCALLLISTVVLANQVSYLKSALHSKRHTRNNGDFLTISSSFWPNESDKWTGSQLLKGPNLSMGDLPINGGSTSKGQLTKDRNKESSKNYTHEQDVGRKISLHDRDDS